VAWHVCMDESGDHGLHRFDPNYPLFVLVAVLLKSPALRQLEDAFYSIKQAYFGNPDLVFHEREIRRREGPYANLGPEAHQRFVEDLTHEIDRLNFKIVAAVIDKRRLVRRYLHPRNPYEIALGFTVERIALEVSRDGDPAGVLPICIEGRGRKEDRELLRVFRAYRAGTDPLSRTLHGGARAALGRVRLEFEPKSANIAGLQLADLVARPIGLSHLRPGQRNRAAEVVRAKFRRGPDGQVEGYGLKVFP